MYEHPIEPNFDTLNEIRNIQMFSETVKQNLSHKVKYNQGIGYAKKAVNLALETGCEDELNKLLQDWIKVKERTIQASPTRRTFQILTILVRFAQRVLPKNA